MTDRQKCGQLVMDYADVVRTQDRRSFDRVFCERSDCRLISIDREFCGRDAIFEDFLIARIRAKFSEITLVTESLEFVPVSADVMLIVFGYHTECVLRESGEPFGIRGMETQLAVRENGEWRLLHVHYSKGA